MYSDIEQGVSEMICMNLGIGIANKLTKKSPDDGCNHFVRQGYSNRFCNVT
jgi:hypothetical protein